VSIQNERDLQGIRRAGRVVAAALAAMRAAVRPGATTADLDEVGARVLARSGARSAPRMVYGFPGITLISVNDEIVHGIPGDRRLRPGDVVKLDVTADLDGYVADAAETVVVPPAAPVAARLDACAREAFRRGARAARPGRQVREIGAAVERHVRSCGFHVVRELTGHGVGRTIHEEPPVPNYDDPFARQRLTEGLVITIEPLIAASRARAVTAADGWTIRTHNAALAAHYEHTLIVWPRGVELVTAAGPE
jgi:methionyl aminopeptidase